MKWQLRSIHMLFVFWILFALVLKEIESIKCYTCNNWLDPTNCTSTANDKLETCADNTRTCIIGTGTRPEQKGNVTKLTPAMGRRCSDVGVEDSDYEQWKSANDKGHKTICYLTVGYRDRKCICGESNCNKQMWNEVMVQPVLQANQSVTDIPVVPTLGENALEKVIAATYPSNMVIDNYTGSILGTPNRPSKTTVLTWTTSTIPTTAESRISTAIPKPAESAGLSAGLLAGVAVGALLLLGLIGFAVYWFKFRTRKERGSADSAGSANSADTDASEEED